MSSHSSSAWPLPSLPLAIISSSAWHQDALCQSVRLSAIQLLIELSACVCKHTDEPKTGCGSSAGEVWDVYIRQTNRFCFLNLIKLTANSNFPFAAANIRPVQWLWWMSGRWLVWAWNRVVSPHTYSILNCMKAQGMLGNVLWTCFTNLVAVFVLWLWLSYSLVSQTFDCSCKVCFSSQFILVKTTHLHRKTNIVYFVHLGHFEVGEMCLFLFAWVFFCLKPQH